jgi:hypothetical protein
VTNDLCYVRADVLQLDSWRFDEVDGGLGEQSVDEPAVTAALKSLTGQPVEQYLTEVADELARYDWRTSAAEGLTEDQRVAKLGFRGSGGYKELRRQLLLHLGRTGGDIGRAARDVHQALGY